MKELTGTWSLIRLILRRDRFILPLWIFWLAFIPIAGVSAFKELYPTAASRETFVQVANASPAFTALLGSVYNSSLGALVAWRYSIIAVFAALASLLTVIRHTRTEEEAGRRELLGSTVIGRHAPLSAALIVTFMANLVLGALIAGGLMGQGLDETGSLATGMSYASAGWVFMAIGAAAAQMTKNAGSARGIAGILLGLAFLLRGIGTAGNYDYLLWLTPLGWAELIRPFAGEEWWILSLVLAAFIVFAGISFFLSSKRDIGAGILAERLGPPSASSRLGSSFGLARRLQRNTILSWAFGIGIYSFFMGNIVQSIKDMLKDNPQLKAFFAQIGGEAGLTETALAVFAGIIGLGVTAYSLQAAFKARNEETSLRAEPVLATSVGRLRWVFSHLVFAFFGPALVLSLSGLIMGLTYGATTNDIGREVGRLMSAALVQLPAVWVITGLGVLLFGLLPRLTSLAWAALISFFLLNMLGDILNLPDWVLDISPFAHVPKLPAADFSLTPIVWLLGIAVSFTIAGLVCFRRRDISR